MQKITLNGTLSISDTPSILNHMNYIITNLVDKKDTSITNILDTIFKSSNSIDKIVEIFGVIYITGHNFSGFGKLVFGKEDFKAKVNEYFVNGFPLDRQLFELIDQNVQLTISDYTDSIGEFINTMDTTEEMQYVNATKVS